MTSKRTGKVYTPPIYHGDQDKDRLPYEGPALSTKADKTNRGRRAAREGSGVVSGSGSTAGGTGGVDEDYDSDPVGGGGPAAMPTSHKGE